MSDNGTRLTTGNIVRHFNERRTERQIEYRALPFCQGHFGRDLAYPPGFSHVVIRLPQCLHSRRRMIRPPQVGRVYTTRKCLHPQQRQARPFRSAGSGDAAFIVSVMPEFLRYLVCAVERK